jgi:hypothetical protein
VSYETVNPVAVVDEESDPPCVVTRYPTAEQAEWFIGYLEEHGGTTTAEKVRRGGYGIDDGSAVP